MRKGMAMAPQEVKQLFDKIKELEGKLANINKIIGPQIDLLKIDRNREGAYKITLLYEQISKLRSILSCVETEKDAVGSKRLEE